MNKTKNKNKNISITTQKPKNVFKNNEKNTNIRILKQLTIVELMIGFFTLLFIGILFYFFSSNITNKINYYFKINNLNKQILSSSEIAQEAKKYEVNFGKNFINEAKLLKQLDLRKNAFDGDISYGITSFGNCAYCQFYVKNDNIPLEACEQIVKDFIGKYTIVAISHPNSKAFDIFIKDINGKIQTDEEIGNNCKLLNSQKFSIYTFFNKNAAKEKPIEKKPIEKILLN